MRQSPYQAIKPYLPYVQGLTLVVLAVVGIANFVSLRSQLYEGVRRPIEERLQDRVRSWEDQLLERLRVALVTAAEQSDDPQTAEASVRSQMRYIESIVLWDPVEAPTRALPMTRPGAQLLHPRSEAPPNGSPATDHPCIREVLPLQYASDAEPLQVAAAWLASCADAPAAVRVEASIEAAGILIRTGSHEDAGSALDAAGLPTDLSLRDALRMGIPIDRTIVFLNRRAETLMLRGLEQGAIDRYLQTGLDLAALSPPDAAGLETWRWTLLEELRSHDRDRAATRLSFAFEALDRRLRAYEEVRTRLAPEATALSSREPRLVRDQYFDRSYVLFYGIVDRADGRRIGAALQLDEQHVLASFLSEGDADRDQLVIRDPNGAWVLGKRAGAGDISVEVPLARTLPHFRVGIYDEYVQARMASLRGQWLVPLVFTAFVLLIGIAALSIQITYARGREELIVRQREFTTRVTHELKTPLAGIRVMAENIEHGAFRDEAGRAAMAARIVGEADRLTERIDELLRFARRREIPDPELFDVEELLFELADLWGPRMEQRGVQLEVDVDEAPQVKGDPLAVRDAIGSLLDNALKYRREDRDDAFVRVSLAREGRDAIVTVTDNGIGVPAAMRTRIFERFVRVEGPNRGMAGGHGLGLAQVADTARAHRGAVACTDGIDGGSTFTLRLRGEPEPG
jgi:signal transduction histidine kinase